DGENLDKMKEKGDECIFVGYSTHSRAYRVFNKRTRVIMESIHVNFDELPQMALSPGRKCQENVSHGDKTVTTSNELDLLFSLMFDELLNGSSKVVSKSSAVSAADESIQRQQPTTPLNISTTPAPTCQTPANAQTVISSENINQAEPHAKNDQVEDDEFINIFSTPCWTKDHPLEQVIGNPSQSVRTRRQLESDAEICMFALTVSRNEPKNIKEAMADSAWIESMQEELHQFDRLDVWELVDRPYAQIDGENLDKMKEKGDECIFVGYSTQSRAYRVFNKRTRVIMESIHVNFDELPHQALVHNSSDPALTRQVMASVQNSTDPGPTRHSMASAHHSCDPAPTCQKKASVQISSDPAPECQTMVLDHSSLIPGRNCQENVSHGDKTGLVFQPNSYGGFSRQ
nr:Gag-Pol polyprotein [Tanacetum cinerariifolium]